MGLYEKLKEYSRSDMYPFHMPGHKRQAQCMPMAGVGNPYEIDITEVDGFDNLHHPENLLKESMERAAKVYGADKTYYLVNGSSGGILSAVCASVRRGGRLLMARNCHKSAYHGVILNDLKTGYVYPQTIDTLGIQGGICVDDVDRQLEKYTDTEAVLIVSPTYDGVLSDVAAIAQAAHRHGVPLIVDEAHGAHFSFGMCRPALECGADIVIQSLHKTLPSLTQTAVLHVRGDRVGTERLERYLQIFQSSSPSYVLMASIEACIREMAEHGKAHMEAFQERLRALRGALGGLRAMRVLGREMLMPGCDLDESKLVVSVRGCMRLQADGSLAAVDGVWLEEALRQRFHLEMEMAGADYVVAILTYLDTPEGLGRLRDALLALDAELVRQEPAAVPVGAACLQSPEICMTLADAMDADCQVLDLETCAGRVSAEFIYLYPPGIPIVAPGERITEAAVRQVAAYRRMGLPVQGMADKDARRLRVAAEGRK